MDKKALFKTLAIASIATCSGLALGFGSGLGSNFKGVDAEVSGEKVESVVTPNAELVKNVDAMTELNVMTKLSEELINFKDTGEKLSQEKLDAYLYYLIQHELNPYKFYTASDSLLSFVEAATLLEELYTASGVDPGFTWVEEDGVKSTITLTRAIGKPGTYQEVIEEVKEAVSSEIEKQEESSETSKDDTSEISSAVNVEVPTLVSEE